MLETGLTGFKILDIINIKRDAITFKTVNKDCYVLSCRIHGESTFFYNGSSHPVNTGDVLYIPHGAAYQQTCQEEEIIAIHLDLGGYVPKDIQICTPEDPRQMCALFQSIYAHWHEKAPGSVYRCMADLYTIAAITHLFDAGNIDNAYGIISPAVRYLQAHLYDSDLSLQTVYRQSPISQTSFIKHFRKHFSCTPIQYVNVMRIQKAQLLLCSGLYTREEIAQLCGFENVKHFYVVFKKIIGCTTGEFLKTAVNKIR